MSKYHISSANLVESAQRFLSHRLVAVISLPSTNSEQLFDWLHHPVAPTYLDQLIPLDIFVCNFAVLQSYLGHETAKLRLLFSLLRDHGIESDRFIGPPISADIRPFEYRPIYEFPSIFWCACLYSLPNSSLTSKFLLKFVPNQNQTFHYTLAVLRRSV